MQENDSYGKSIKCVRNIRKTMQKFKYCTCMLCKWFTAMLSKAKPVTGPMVFERAKSSYAGMNTGCGRNNSHILKVYKNQTKQGTQKILLFIKSTYDVVFFKCF